MKITQALPSSLTFPEAVEVPNTVRRKLMKNKNVFILSKMTFLFPKRNTTKLSHVERLKTRRHKDKIERFPARVKFMEHSLILLYNALH